MIELNDIGASAFIVSRRADDQFVYDTINTAAERMTGLSNADVSGRLLTQLFREDVASMLAANYAACLHDRTPVEFERTVPLPLGKLTVRTTLTPIFDAGIHGPVTRLFGVAIDITDQHRIQEGLKSTNARLAIAMDALGGAHWYFDVRQKRFELSPGFDRILGGNSPSSMALEEWLCRVHPDDREDTCFADILAGRSEQGMAEFRVIANSGDVRWLRCRRRAVQSGPTLTGIAGVVLDVTQEKRREATLSLQAASDPLTGLANRRRFEEVFAAEREQAALCHSALSLLMVDVDHFKAYNDTYGHIAGDEVLKRVATCIKSTVARAGGTAARYGGEEFVAVLPGRDSASAAKVADQILAAAGALDEPHSASPLGILSVSIGVAGHSRVAGKNAANLIALADAALYRAKNDGRDCYRVMVAHHLHAVQQDQTSSAA